MAAKDLKNPVLVTWVDSCGSSGWRRLDRETAHHEERTMVDTCRSVGFILRQDRREIVLVSSVDDTVDNGDHIMAIPRVAIKSIQHLEVKDARQGDKDRRQVSGNDTTRDQGEGDH